MQLSKYFTLEELFFSDTAARKGIDNTPSPAVQVTLGATAKAMDEVRQLLGHPVRVLSGYRCPRLNTAVGGAKTSAHLTGNALDFICPQFGTVRQVFDAIRASGLQFDQLIIERPDSVNGGWVHIAFGGRNRRECLSYDGKGYSIA